MGPILGPALDLILAHYNPSKRLILKCDLSKYEVGAVLSHQLEDSSKRPIDLLLGH